jgi:hypothetical protein
MTPSLVVVHALEVDQLEVDQLEVVTRIGDGDEVSIETRRRERPETMPAIADCPRC